MLRLLPACASPDNIISPQHLTFEILQLNSEEQTGGENAKRREEAKGQTSSVVWLKIFVISLGIINGCFAGTSQNEIGHERKGI